MAMGYVGEYIGMTRVFTPEGKSIPVSVIEVKNRVTAKKTEETDGYNAYQITAGIKAERKLNKPEAGLFKKAGVEPGKLLKEFRVEASVLEGINVGDELDLGGIAEGSKVDVAGNTIGKGFAGTVKRHNFRTQDATHGNSLSHRVPGSIGQCQTPGRVFKGKKMSGHMGNVRRTQQNLTVVRVDAERKLLLVKGAVPGAKGGMLVIKPAVKQTAEATAQSGE